MCYSEPLRAAELAVVRRFLAARLTGSPTKLKEPYGNTQMNPDEIDAFAQINAAEFDATTTFAVQTLLGSLFYFRDHIAKTGQRFEDITAADIIADFKRQVGTRTAWKPSS